MPKPLIRVYINQPLMAGGTVVLSQPHSHYVTTVMRHSMGDSIELFNGKEGAWTAEITDANRKRCALVLQAQIVTQEIPPDLWLCMALLKKDRIDWTVEKACELGVARVVPVITDRTVIDRVNLERLTAHMIEASEQCGRTHVPTIREPVTLMQLLKGWPDDRQLLFCDEKNACLSPLVLEGGAKTWENAGSRSGFLTPRLNPIPSILPQWEAGQKEKKHAILIGPEGGFTDAERQAIRAIPQAKTLSLGPRILRADTAAVAAIALFQSTIGDW